jgi:ABC-type transport system involved in cytochrome bd biosynthesis fused ATPase/permease subunit
MVELFADLPPEHEFFQQFSFISSDDLPEFQQLLTRVPRERLNDASPADRMRLMSLPFKLIPTRHRIFQIEPELEAKLIEAREAFARDLPPALAKNIAFFDPDRYLAGANILDNILFGKVVYGQAQAAEQVAQLVGELLAQLDLRDTVARVGFGFECGIAGGRLTAAQRQRLGLARAILKRPDILLLADAFSALDAGGQAQTLDAILAEFKDRTVVATLPRASLARRFDRVLTFEGGRLVEQGTLADLDREGTHFHRLLAHE